MSDHLIPARKVWERYGIVDRTLDRWLANSALGFPRPTVINGRRYFVAEQILAWERARSGLKQEEQTSENTTALDMPVLQLERIEPPVAPTCAGEGPDNATIIVGPNIKSSVYFISAIGRKRFPIKIGYTLGAVRERLSSIQPSCPYELEILASLPGDVALEKSLHFQFWEERMKGEWFRRSPQLEKYIKSIKPEKSEIFRKRLLQPQCRDSSA